MYLQRRSIFLYHNILSLFIFAVVSLQFDSPSVKQKMISYRFDNETKSHLRGSREGSCQIRLFLPGHFARVALRTSLMHAKVAKWHWKSGTREKVAFTILPKTNTLKKNNKN